MSKEAKPVSVLQEWVMRLPLREQGTLLTCVRGCDVTPKYPLDSLERRIVGAIRYAFMVPADLREVDSEPGCFFLSKPPTVKEFKPSALGHYPLHWLTHLMHSAEVIGYRHPDEELRDMWLGIYFKLANSLHMNPETRAQMIARLGEDRIAKGTVVS